MDCGEIKKIIPRYYNHTANEEEIKKVEEHLCVCHECRQLLGELMDQVAEANEAGNLPAEPEEMQIISPDEIGSIPSFQDSEGKEEKPAKPFKDDSLSQEIG